MNRLDLRFVTGCFLLLLSFLQPGCVSSAGRVGVAPETAGTATALPMDHEALFEAPCTETATEPLAGGKKAVTFHEAVCIIRKIEESGDPAQIRSLAREGIDLTEDLLVGDPGDGPTRYLKAILLGHLAGSSPLQALDLVPRIESEAREAARVTPGFDEGGPHRLLGELYRKAPEPPVSLGDPAQALEHYSRAVELSPENPENRLGLAETLMDDGRPEEACEQLRGTRSGPSRPPFDSPVVERIDFMLRIHCAEDGNGSREGKNP